MGVPILWAQGPGPAQGAVAFLALRRWCSSLTLSSPVAFPRPWGLWAWLGGLGALLLIAMIAQGPIRALRQVFDVPGHLSLISASMKRLWRAGRLVAVLFGMTILVWTANQTVSFSQKQGDRSLSDLAVLLQKKSLGEVAVEQGILAALTPVRDVFGLGDMLPLLILGAALAFRYSADRWGGLNLPGSDPQTHTAGWTSLFWGAAWLYVLYRFASMIDPGDLPLGGCLFVEAGVVPVLMLLADGLLAAWVLVELRSAGLGMGGEPLDIGGTLTLVPCATLACALALPARYFGTGALLAFLHVPRFANGVPLWAYERLGWSLVGLQGIALVFVGFAGVAAWTQGNIGAAIRAYGRLLATEGGRLVAGLALAGLAAGGLSGLAYAAVLTLPRQFWVLEAADSYAHYATLPVGLLTVSALVALAERSLPTANLVKSEVSEPMALAS